MQKKIGIGIVGCGVVGGGVVELLRRHRGSIEEQADAALELRYVVVRDTNKARQVALDDTTLTADFAQVLRDPQVSIVVELMGGTDVAHSVVREALLAGKHVVTANKALLAERGEGLFALAERMGLTIAFEASVCGGIPIIRTLCEGMSGDRVRSVRGILNATTNFILSRMSEDGMDYAQALAIAQRRGLAEGTPTLDVDGHDAAQKLAILASLAFRSRVPCEAVFRQGIAELRPLDLRFARELGYVVKLLGQARLVERASETCIDARVHPVLVKRDHLLAAVRDEYNAVLVDADFVGPTAYQGRGAGAHPTASAVMADIVALARRMDTCPRAARPPCSRTIPLVAMDQIEGRYYLRLDVADRPGVLHAIAGHFGRHGVGIATVTQKKPGDAHVPLVITTHQARERDVQAALSLAKQSTLADVGDTCLLRIMDDDQDDEPTTLGAVA
jgi:homoserine dehydrogenase